jgi:predicted nucleotide-binding protein
MEEKIIYELNNLIANPDSSTFALLNKAIQLATINNDKFYELLFRYHTQGLNKADTEQLSKTNPDLLSMFSADRMKTGETFYLLGSISNLESSLKQYEEDIKSAFSDLERIKADEPLYATTMHQVKKSSASSLIGALRTNQSKVIDIILKIRSRVASFANQEAIKLLKRQTSKLNNKIMGNKIFIGHGRSNVWRDLKDFLQDRLKLNWDEYNREPTAGMAIKERLEQMLDDASFAFLVMTAEDEHADSLLHARENVTHEVGLFQGRLGFRKAIVLLEEGCQEFSNIHGLSQIRFPKGNVAAKSEEIRRVLEREGLLENN